MKTTALIGFVCGVASIAQCAQFTDLRVDGILITPTTGGSIDQLEQDPWWGSSALSFQFAVDYGQALFNWAKYNDPSMVEHLPDIYFAFHADDGNYVDTWVLDQFTGRMYEDDGLNIHNLLALDPPPGGWPGDVPATVPDCTSTVELMVVAFGGLVLSKRKQSVGHPR